MTFAVDESLESLLTRTRELHGKKLVLRGSAGHKGRVGDEIERLLLGQSAGSRKTSDHPAAEIKSVPVFGNLVVERVKLGVLSEHSNPLLKCASVLFVFVEKRGDAYFVRGHHYVAFSDGEWQTLWDQGLLVETAAGSTEHRARGLYLNPGFFRTRAIWPQRAP